MDHDLDAVELRVLGCLIEKQHTTPDNYPLSTNALRSACNQKTSRDPVLDISEREVDGALLSLRDRGLARSLRPSGSRAWKHRQVVAEVLPLSDSELALLAVLMLRGPQTPGELRSRTERMAVFEDVDAVEESLRSLADRAEPLAVNLGRGPGQSQDRWAHLLGAEKPSSTASPGAPSSARGGGAAVSDHAPAFHSGAPATVNPSPHLDDFRQLHSGFFVMPNPWDRGSARILEELGFPALATTSSGHGRSLGKDDQEVTRDELVAHVRDLTEFIGVPLNADSERLFPDDAGGIEETVRLLVAAGASGCSIEDYDPATGTIDDLATATAAVERAAEASGRHGIVLTARAENHLYGVDDLDDTIERLLAYEAAGADVVYAPGLVGAAHIARVIDSVSLPVNVLHRPNGPSIDELRELGVSRVSVGGRLHGAAMEAVRNNASELAVTVT